MKAKSNLFRGVLVGLSLLIIFTVTLVMSEAKKESRVYSDSTYPPSSNNMVDGGMQETVDLNSPKETVEETQASEQIDIPSPSGEETLPKATSEAFLSNEPQFSNKEAEQATTVPIARSTPKPGPTRLKTDPTTGPAQGGSENESEKNESVFSDADQAEWILG